MVKKIVCALALLLLLSACGTGEQDRRIDALEEENAALRAQIEELKDNAENPCGAGEQENRRIADLEEENAALRAQIEEFENNAKNPIDSFYDAAETNGTTVAMNFVAESCADAWEAEARHLAEVLKSRLPLREDRELVDAYIAAAVEQIQRMDVMAIYPISDVSVPGPERISGTLRGLLWAGGRSGIWRDTFYQLHGVLPFQGEYEFIFDASAAEEEFMERYPDIP